MLILPAFLHLVGKEWLAKSDGFWHFWKQKFKRKNEHDYEVKIFIKKAPKRGDTVTTATIYARLTIGHKTDISATLPLSVNPNHWDVAGQCVNARAVCDERMRTEINNRLLELRQHINSTHDSPYTRVRFCIVSGCVRRSWSSSASSQTRGKTRR